MTAADQAGSCSRQPFRLIGAHRLPAHVKAVIASRLRVSSPPQIDAKTAALIAACEANGGDVAAAAGLVWWLGRSPGGTHVAQAPSPGTVVPPPPSAGTVVPPPSAAGGRPVAALPLWRLPDGTPFAEADRKLLQRSISDEVALP